MNVLQSSIAAMPFLLATMSRTGKAVRPVPSDEPLHGAAASRTARKSSARCPGMLIAASRHTASRRLTGFRFQRDRKEKARRGGPVAPDFLLAGPGLRAPRCQAFSQSSAGDPSEVTALEIRHWITSFRWFRETSI
jgi:hypothetical protein